MDTDNKAIDTDNKAIHSVVVGMSAAGLTSALNLLMQGHNVTLIDKRAHYVLRQKVYIPMELIQKFFLFDFDDAFLKKLVENGSITSLRKIQTYQFNLLKSMYEQKKVLLRNGQSKAITGNLQILRGEEFEISIINGESQSLVLKNGTRINFDNIIDATGSKRDIASLLNMQSNGKYRIEYATDLPQLDHTENAIIYFNAPVTKNVFQRPENASNNYHLSDFSEKNWNKERVPDYYLRTNVQKQRIYLLTEIPEEYIGEKNPNKIIDFAAPILKEECGIEAAALTVDRDKLKVYSTFHLKRHEIADKPYVVLGLQGVCLVVGDAFSPANFHFGHGVSKAIDDGINLSQVFAHKKFNPEALKERAKKIRSEFCREMSQKLLINQRKKNELNVQRMVFTPRMQLNNGCHNPIAQQSVQAVKCESTGSLYESVSTYAQGLYSLFNYAFNFYQNGSVNKRKNPDSDSGSDDDDGHKNKKRKM